LGGEITSVSTNIDPSAMVNLLVAKDLVRGNDVAAIRRRMYGASTEQMRVITNELLAQLIDWSNKDQVTALLKKFEDSQLRVDFKFPVGEKK
jgi:hypothetical protein